MSADERGWIQPAQFAQPGRLPTSASDTDTTLKHRREDGLIVTSPTPSRVREYTETTDPLLGSLIDNRYRVHRTLGTGGMATVYLGTHAVTDAKLAIKVVDVRKQKRLNLRERLLQEARSAMVISSNHVARAYDVGALPDGRLYIVQEYLDGEDLETVLEREGPLPWSRVARIAIDICSGLSAAHRHGIIHRDIKPGNCFRVSMDGDPDHIKIIDFGIARDEREEAGITQEGILLGTPEYTAPEMVSQGIRANPQTDVYAVGITLFKLLTGTTPFRGNDPYEVLRKHVEQKPPLPSREAPHLGIPRAADAIVMQALEKDLARRFTDAEDMARCIRAALQGPQEVHTGEVVRPPSSPAPDVRTLRSSEQRRPEKPVPVPELAPSPGKPAASVPKPNVTSVPESPSVSASGLEAVDWRLAANRVVTLLLLAIFFVLGTWIVIPEEAQPPSESGNKRVSRLVPRTELARATLAPPESRPTETEVPVSRSEPFEPVTPKSESPPPSPREVVPAPQPADPPSLTAADSAPPPVPQSPEPKLAPAPSPAQPLEPDPSSSRESDPVPTELDTAPSKPEPDFNYKSAGKLIEEQHSYLRRTCMVKGSKPLSQLKFRVDVRPTGRHTIKVEAAASVRDCVRENFLFPFDPSPRGGAFIYRLSQTKHSLEPVPLESTPGR